MSEVIIPLMSKFEKLEDERSPQGKRYSLVSILVLCFVSTICGYKTYKAMSEFCNNYQSEMSECLGLGKRSPCAATIYNVLKKVGVKKFEKAISEWVEVFLEKEDELNIDGKTMRGTKKKGGKFSHLLSAFSDRLGITVHQVPVDEKSNEISAIIELLSGIILEGKILTMDALLTQREIAEKIVSKEADYVMVAKNNQPSLRHEIMTLIELKELWKPNIDTFEKVETKHGRTEKRKITVTDAEMIGWPGANQVFRIEREITRKGKTSREVLYGITSLSREKAGAERLLQINRNHWSIENKSHWVRDVTFDEDRIQIKNDNIAQIMAIIRNVAIGLIRFDGHNNIAQATRFFADNPFHALALVMLKIK